MIARKPKSRFLRSLVNVVLGVAAPFCMPVVANAGEIYHQTNRVKMIGAGFSNVSKPEELTRDVEVSTDLTAGNLTLEYHLIPPKDEENIPLHLKTWITNQEAGVFLVHNPEVEVGNSTQRIFSEKAKTGRHEIELQDSTKAGKREMELGKKIWDRLLELSPIPSAQENWERAMNWYAENRTNFWVEEARTDFPKGFLVEIPLYGTARILDQQENISGVENGRKIVIPLRGKRIIGELIAKLNLARGDRAGTLYLEIPLENLDINQPADARNPTARTPEIKTPQLPTRTSPQIQQTPTTTARTLEQILAEGPGEGWKLDVQLKDDSSGYLTGRIYENPKFRIIFAKQEQNYYERDHSKFLAKKSIEESPKELKCFLIKGKEIISISLYEKSYSSLKDFKKAYSEYVPFATQIIKAFSPENQIVSPLVSGEKKLEDYLNEFKGEEKRGGVQETPTRTAPAIQQIPKIIPTSKNLEKLLETGPGKDWGGLGPIQGKTDSRHIYSTKKFAIGITREIVPQEDLEKRIQEIKEVYQKASDQDKCLLKKGNELIQIRGEIVDSQISLDELEKRTQEYIDFANLVIAEISPEQAILSELVSGKKSIKEFERKIITKGLEEKLTSVMTSGPKWDSGSSWEVIDKGYNEYIKKCKNWTYEIKTREIKYAENPEKVKAELQKGSEPIRVFLRKGKKVITIIAQPTPENYSFKEFEQRTSECLKFTGEITQLFSPEESFVSPLVSGEEKLEDYKIKFEK